MYDNTDKQLWLKFKISLVLSIVGTVIMVISNIVNGTFNITNIGNLLEQLALIVFSPILMTIAVYGLLLNYRKIFSGIVTPIPIVSMIIEYFKGFFMAIFAFIHLIKSRNVAENSVVDVILVDIGENRTHVIKAFRELSGFDLKHAGEFVDNAPIIVKKAVPEDVAEEIKARFEEAGATIAFQ